MKTKLFKSTTFLILMLVASIYKSQGPVIRDKWDTLYKNPTVITSGIFTHKNNIVLNNNILYYGDTANILQTNSKSFIKSFNTTTNLLSNISFTKTPEDIGLNCAASVTTNTANLKYVFFGAKCNYLNQTNNFTIYKLNSQTGVVTSDTINHASAANSYGTENLCFFSPTTNHDSLLIFGNFPTSTQIYKKHYNQTGYINSNVSLAIEKITKTIVYNNVLYIGGYGANTMGLLINSTNGNTYTVNTNTSAFLMGGQYITDMDTLNNELYLSVFVTDGYYSIYKTNDGITFNELISPWPFGYVTSLKKFKGKMWYSINEGSACGLCYDRPTVSYLSGPTFTVETLSIDTIGRSYNKGNTFNLATANNSLILGGNYNDAVTFGSFIYKFLPPVANFSIASTNVCLNGSYTVTNNSQNADSVRWIKDANFYSGINNNFSFSFSTTGTHTLGLIAISGTQKDTLKLVLNVYSVSALINGPTTACQSASFQLTSNLTGALGSVTYSWTQVPSFTAAVASASSIIVPGLSTGNFTYNLSVKDANNCIALSPSFTLNALPSKNIIGSVLNSSSAPVTGSVSLYRFEPILTKFDSITTVSIDAAGNYTFVNANSNIYLVKSLPTSTTQQITYGNSSLSWQSATQLNHGCINTSTQNITVIDLLNIGTGPGQLSGVILQGPGYGQRSASGIMAGPIKGVVVKGGKNPGGNYFAEGRTNSSGQYSFTNVPVCGPGESYFVLVDVPGLDTNGTYHRVITSTNLQFTDLDFTIDSAKVNPIGNFTGVNEFKLGNNNVIVYPNPANEHISIEYDLLKPAVISYEIKDVLGKTVFIASEKTIEENGTHKKTITTAYLPDGIYFIKVRINESEKTIKLIIN